jgi:hypothetical protein
MAPGLDTDLRSYPNPKKWWLCIILDKITKIENISYLITTNYMFVELAHFLPNKKAITERTCMERGWFIA